MFQVQPFKVLNAFLCAHFWVTVKDFRGPPPSQTTAFQSDILELASFNNLTQHEMCPIFFFSKLAHLELQKVSGFFLVPLYRHAQSVMKS